tara:strand:+ start:8497 stop:8622 length:126 start_codon:yes stop_codon:yes gene_type:complete
MEELVFLVLKVDDLKCIYFYELKKYLTVKWALLIQIYVIFK